MQFQKKKKKKGKNRKCGVFSCIKVIKISFSAIFNEKIMLRKGFFITVLAHKRCQLQSALLPDPIKGSTPWTTAGGSASWTPRLLCPPPQRFTLALPLHVIYHIKLYFNIIKHQKQTSWKTPKFTEDMSERPKRAEAIMP